MSNDKADDIAPNESLDAVAHSGKDNTRSDDDWDRFFKTYSLSKDLRKASTIAREDIARALFVKFQHALNPDTLGNDLGDLKETLIEEMRAYVAEVIGIDEPTPQQVKERRATDPEFKSYLYDTGKAIRELEKLITAAEDLDDEDAFEFATNLVDAITTANQVRARVDIVPLIDRGLYGTDLRSAVEFWDKHKDSPEGWKEQTWQNELMSRKAVLERIVGGKVLLVAGQVHVGGTGLDGKGGKISDFMFENSDTRDVTLIEIKTPHTPLLGKTYRNTYPLSDELSGSVAQVLIQRAELMKNFFQKKVASGGTFEVYAPKCILIAGSLGTQIGSDKDKARAFEIQRQAVHANVTITTFDELYAQFARFHGVD